MASADTPTSEARFVPPGAEPPGVPGVPAADGIAAAADGVGVGVPPFAGLDPPGPGCIGPSIPEALDRPLLPAVEAVRWLADPADAAAISTGALAPSGDEASDGPAAGNAPGAAADVAAAFVAA
jgi:hypothetical protein